MSDTNRKFQILMRGRDLGRTKAMIEGLHAVPSGVVVAVTHSQAKQLQDRIAAAGLGNKVICLNDLESHIGTCCPLIADHFALQVLWAEREWEHQKELAKAKEKPNGTD